MAAQLRFAKFYFNKLLILIRVNDCIDEAFLVTNNTPETLISEAIAHNTFKEENLMGSKWPRLRFLIHVVAVMLFSIFFIKKDVPFIMFFLKQLNI